YTACLAHAEVTFVEETGEVIRVIGYFGHNDMCKESMLVRFPAVPLAPHVVEIALLQLRGGADVAQIRNRNMEMFSRQLYRGQRDVDPMQQNMRYELQTSDFSRLYRQHYRADYNIDVSIPPEYNVDNWLDPTSPHYKRDIADSIFHYAARAENEERFKVCIATPEMRTAAWKYCHQKQLVLDGTFGVCTSKLLLWIAMGVDEAHHGVPVAMFLFSAPSGNRATHAGYDTEILTEILGSWRDWMGKSPDEANIPFEPFVAMTDTDQKERGALLNLWPNIILLLCKFHVRQCWKNKRNSLYNKQAPHWRSYLESRAQTLEEALLQTVAHEVAVTLLADEEETLHAIATADAAGGKASQAGLSYLEYLRSQWMPVPMWTGWSRRGRENAAKRMGISVDEVLPTTNHLEAFNGSLKRNHL
ncbi:uncharacterized protein TRAVEDRAFT_97696, partial [Trametes versicolor FP-101664 SS1]|uniref:uncharacterized protein n=1 Tax=Trametes versicolor (strain FP-101664) TaxID=717944 RepID=UPI0004624346